MEELSELEKIRLENVQFMNNFWEAELANLDLPEELTNSSKEKKKKPTRRSRRSDDDPFYIRLSVPLERRFSSRIRKAPPEFTYEDLPDEKEQGHSNKENSYSDLNKVKFRVVKGRKSSSRSTVVPFVAAEDISTNYINNIAKKGTVKVYSESGTSCHQCRQKTLDSKTYCRSGRCIGVRGQFCGVCLLNRYGEIAAVALKDPKWICPPCRGICNCSICRTREGKVPTGILAPVAQSSGYRSVKDFLVSLGGIGDYSTEDIKMEIPTPNPVKETVLVGFDKEGSTILKGGQDDYGDLLGFDGEFPVTRIFKTENEKNYHKSFILMEQSLTRLCEYAANFIKIEYDLLQDKNECKEIMEANQKEFKELSIKNVINIEEKAIEPVQKCKEVVEDLNQPKSNEEDLFHPSLHSASGEKSFASINKLENAKENIDTNITTMKMEVD